MSDATVSFRRQDIILQQQEKQRLLQIVKQDMKNAQSWLQYLTHQRNVLAGQQDSRSKLASEWGKLAELHKQAVRSLQGVAEDEFFVKIKAGLEEASG